MHIEGLLAWISVTTFSINTIVYQLPKYRCFRNPPILKFPFHVPTLPYIYDTIKHDFKNNGISGKLMKHTTWICKVKQISHLITSFNLDNHVS